MKNEYVTMLLVDVLALVHNTYGFITADKPNILLAVIDVVLIILALFLAYTAIVTIKSTRKGVPAEWMKNR